MGRGNYSFPTKSRSYLMVSPRWILAEEREMAWAGVFDITESKKKKEMVKRCFSPPLPRGWRFGCSQVTSVVLFSYPRGLPLDVSSNPLSKRIKYPWNFLFVCNCHKCISFLHNFPVWQYLWRTDTIEVNVNKTLKCTCFQGRSNGTSWLEISLKLARESW